MALGDVGDLVSDDRGELALAAAGQHQPGVDPHEAPGQGKGVDHRVLDEEEVETLLGAVARADDAIAERLDIAAELGVFHEREALPDLPHDHLPEPPLLLGGQRVAGRVADRRQLVGRRGSAADGDQRNPGGDQEST